MSYASLASLASKDEDIRVNLTVQLNPVVEVVVILL